MDYYQLVSDWLRRLRETDSERPLRTPTDLESGGSRPGSGGGGGGAGPSPAGSSPLVQPPVVGGPGVSVSVVAGASLISSVSALALGALASVWAAVSGSVGMQPVENDAPGNPSSFADAFDNPKLGHYWTAGRGSWSVAGGAVSVASVPAEWPAVLLYVADTFAEGSASGVVDVAGELIGVACCGSMSGGAFSGYVAGKDTTRLRLWRVDANVKTSLVFAAVTVAAGDDIRIERVAGDTLNVYHNELLKLTTTDATYQSGYAGLVVQFVADGFRSFAWEKVA